MLLFLWSNNLSFCEKSQKGKFTLSIMYEQLQDMLEMGPISQEFVRPPRLRYELIPKGRQNESHAKIKRT
ncbi:Signal recognition particle 54 kDa protein 2 [Euphorbia peplus]|nr:Signal recognition particle 54 kDa protein 2 [Euphorbia peplus]